MTETESQALAPAAHAEWTDPFDRWFDEIAQRFDAALGIAPQPPAGPRPFRPARADLQDLGTAYRLVAELPGIPKDKLEITVRGSVVELRAEVPAESPAVPGRLLHQERFYQGYFRTLELPEPIVAAKAQATLKDGVLTLDLPKEHPDPTPIEVKVAVQ